MADEEAVPSTGETRPEFSPLDELMTSFLREQKAPGAALALARNGHLLYARGFGYADVEGREPVAPDSLFRIASISKPITAVAVLQLVEQGKIRLDTPVLEQWQLKENPPDPVDERWRRVTPRHLLAHTGGWDRDQSFDPIARPAEIVKTLGAASPASPEDVIRYMFAQPLDFHPGERYAYCNFSYLVLGRMIEAVTGKSYTQYVHDSVLHPLAIRRMRLGRALPEHRAEGEVRYYDRLGRKGTCLFPPRVGEEVPIQYGADNVDGYEAHGGWIASAVELVRFASALDDPDSSPLLSARAIAEMWSCPAGAAGREPSGLSKEYWYGLGWNVRPVKNGRANCWHSGMIAGTSTILVRRWDGLDWAVLFNTHDNEREERLSSLIDPLVHKAVAKIEKWPEFDLFPHFLPVGAAGR